MFVWNGLRFCFDLGFDLGGLGGVFDLFVGLIDAFSYWLLMVMVVCGLVDCDCCCLLLDFDLCYVFCYFDCLM